MTQQEKIKFAKIYDLYSQLIDDLYDGYIDSRWNGGEVDVDGKLEDMGKMLDKLDMMFREFNK